MVMDNAESQFRDDKVWLPPDDIDINSNPCSDKEFVPLQNYQKAVNLYRGINSNAKDYIDSIIKVPYLTAQGIQGLENRISL